MPLLTLLVLVPLAGVAAIALIGKEREALIHRVALVVSLAVFALTLVLWARFDAASADFQFVERYRWIPSLGIDYFVGVDGISLFLLVLTGFLTPLALLSSWESIHSRVKAFAMFVLALEAAMIGVFIALDLFLFYVFWDAMLIPMYFLIGIWGYDNRVYAAIKFMLYTMAGSVLMLIAILALGYYHGVATGLPSFDLLKLYELQIPRSLQFWGFLAFALAFAIKVPIFPFHTWLPDAHVQAPTAGSVILAGVLLKMGTYGLVRFAFPLFPDAALVLRAVPRGRGGDRHHLWRARRDGAAGPEEARRVLERQPSRVRRARHFRDERAGSAGRGVSDARARRQHGRAVPDRRDAVGPPPHATDRRIRRPQEDSAEVVFGVPDRHAGVDRPAGPEWLCRRVADPCGRVPLGSPPCSLCRDRRALCPRSTCCGCSSASTTDRSRTRKTPR